jgi:hypothetical protein
LKSSLNSRRRKAKDGSHIDRAIRKAVAADEEKRRPLRAVYEQVLVPYLGISDEDAECLFPGYSLSQKSGAGEGNRTHHVFSATCVTLQPSATYASRGSGAGCTKPHPIAIFLALNGTNDFYSRLHSIPD